MSEDARGRMAKCIAELEKLAKSAHDTGEKLCSDYARSHLAKYAAGFELAAAQLRSAQAEIERQRERSIAAQELATRQGADNTRLRAVVEAARIDCSRHRQHWSNVEQRYRDCDCSMCLAIAALDAAEGKMNMKSVLKCSNCEKTLEPGVYWMCDEDDGQWCEDCWEKTACSQGVHGEGCPTKVFSDGKKSRSWRKS